MARRILSLAVATVVASVALPGPQGPLWPSAASKAWN
jgi:hypothetical protein